ncbi:MAG: PEP-utilizing enzyme [Actinomycetota bacterium]|nr:PEP-utilizing enzyme [Actinomycetota bacterium]MDA3019480.1 PEP-utilizing enzyme [Actinomycetota bacterium]
MADRWITDRAPSKRWPHYTRANAGEVLSVSASPLSQQFCWENGILLGWRDGYVRGGNYTLDEFTDGEPEVCGFFAGYFYINLANVRMQAVRSPLLTVEQLDLAFFGDHPEVPPYEAHPLDERPEMAEGVLAHLGWVMTNTSIPEVDAEKVMTIALRQARPDLTSLSDAGLLTRARMFQPLLRKLFDSHTPPSSDSAIAPGILGAVCAALGEPETAMKLIAGIGDVDSAEPSYRMWDLSRTVNASAELTKVFNAGVAGLLGRLQDSNNADAKKFVADFAQFIVEFGSRGPNEWEISADTWETKPEYALAVIDRIRLQSDAESPKIRNARKAEERKALTEDIRAKVKPLGEELAGQLEGALIASSQMAIRERTKTNIIRALHEVRMAFRELGRRRAAEGTLKDPHHVFALLDSELDQFLFEGASMKDTLAARHAQWQELQLLEPPFFIKNGIVPPLSEYKKKGQSNAAKAVVGDVVQGVPGCTGQYVGRARVILDPTEPGDLEPGDVLIAPNTDPAWTPLFMSCGAVVVNVGAAISHAIIVSRELGLPCVVSATDATVRILDGALIEVNGDTGAVTILEVPA